LKFRVETAGRLIEQLLPKSIHAVIAEGCELKGALCVSLTVMTRLGTAKNGLEIVAHIVYGAGDAWERPQG
jgi:hypothetical protein